RMEAERDLFAACHRRSDAHERQPHTAQVVGAAHGRFRRTQWPAKPQLVPELFVDRSGSRANAGNTTRAYDFADRSRRRIIAAAGRIPHGAVFGAACSVFAADRAPERCSREIYLMV